MPLKEQMFDLSGKVAAITGASRGIGRSTAENMARVGTRVIIISRNCEFGVTSFSRQKISGLKTSIGGTAKKFPDPV